MVLWNLGSITNQVHNIVTVPTSISGTTLLSIANL